MFERQQLTVEEIGAALVRERSHPVRRKGRIFRERSHAYERKTLLELQECVPPVRQGIAKVLGRMVRRFPLLQGRIKRVMVIPGEYLLRGSVWAELINPESERLWPAYYQAQGIIVNPARLGIASGTIRLNRSYWRGGSFLSKLVPEYLEDARSGFHPPTDDPFSTVTHEAAHELYFALMEQGVDPFRGTLTTLLDAGSVSEYAMKNEKEAFAEAMVWIMHVPRKKWPGIVKSVYKNIRRFMKP